MSTPVNSSSLPGPQETSMKCLVAFTNNNQQPVAFQVVTTGPKLYWNASPNKVDPGESIEISITFQALEDPLPYMLYKNEFLVQSTIATEMENMTLREAWTSPKIREEGKDIQHKLSVTYLSQDDKILDKIDEVVAYDAPLSGDNSVVVGPSRVLSRQTSTETIRQSKGKGKAVDDTSSRSIRRHSVVPKDVSLGGVTFYPDKTLNFRRPLATSVTSLLTIENNEGRPIAFKVKTTAPKCYFARPNLGRIGAGKSTEVAITLIALGEEPPLDFRCKDKFVIESTTISPDMEKLAPSDIFTELITSVTGIDKKVISRRKFDVSFLSQEGRDNLSLYHSLPNESTLDLPLSEVVHAKTVESGTGHAGQVIHFRRLLAEPDTYFLNITNAENQAISFSLQTTSPNLYPMSPDSGRIGPGYSLDLRIQKKPLVPPDTTFNERFFLVTKLLSPDNLKDNLETKVIWSGLGMTEIERGKVSIKYLPADVRYRQLQEEDAVTALPFWNDYPADSIGPNEGYSEISHSEGDRSGYSVIFSPTNTLDFKRSLIVHVTRRLNITNNDGLPVVFKVKVTNPKKYISRPNCGRVEPGKSIDVILSLYPLQDEPFDANFSDKLLIQYAFVTPETGKENMEISNIWAALGAHKMEKIYYRKLRIRAVLEQDDINLFFLSALPFWIGHIKDGMDEMNVDTDFDANATISSNAPISNVTAHDEHQDVGSAHSEGIPTTPIVSLYPSKSLDFRRPLTTNVSRLLTITNNETQEVVYRVQTISRQYAIRSARGRIEPGDSVDVVITLQAFDEEPPQDIDCGDKFIVECALVTPDEEYLALHEILATFGARTDGKTFKQVIDVVYSPMEEEETDEEMWRRTYSRIQRWVNNGGVY